MRPLTSSATFSPTNFSVSVGEWAHITYTADYDSGEALLYKNGVLTDTVDISSLGAWSYTGASNNYDFIDFGRNVSNNNIFYAGSLGNVQIYNRALTQTEIKRNFATQSNRFQVPRWGNRAILQNSLVLWLDAGISESYSGSGSTWSDISGNGYDGTIDGATYGSSDGGSFTFDGANDGVRINTYAAVLHPWGGPATLAMWIKPNGTPAEWDGLWGGGTSVIGVSFGFSTSGKLRMASDSGPPMLNSSSSVTAGVWNHVAFVRDGTTGTFYINGVDAGGSGSWTPDDPASTVDIVIGQYYGNSVSTSYKFDGDIATTTLYTRALSADEVKQNFSAQRDRFSL